MSALEIEVVNQFGDSIPDADVRVGANRAEYNRSRRVYLFASIPVSLASFQLTVSHRRGLYWEFNELIGLVSGRLRLSRSLDGLPGDIRHWISSSLGASSVETGSDGSRVVRARIMLHCLKPYTSELDNALRALPRTRYSDPNVPPSLPLTIPVPWVDGVEAQGSPGQEFFFAANTPFVLEQRWNVDTGTANSHFNRIALPACGGTYRCYILAPGDMILFSWVPSDMNLSSSSSSQRPLHFHLSLLPETLNQAETFPLGESWLGTLAGYTNWDSRYWADQPYSKYYLAQIALSRRKLCYLLPLRRTGKSFAAIFSEGRFDLAIREVSMLVCSFFGAVFSPPTGHLSAAFFSTTGAELDFLTHGTANPIARRSLREIFLFDLNTTDISHHRRRLSAWYLAQTVEGHPRRLRIYTRNQAWWEMQPILARRGEPVAGLVNNGIGHLEHRGGNFVSTAWREFHSTYGSIVLMGDETLSDDPRLHLLSREAARPRWASERYFFHHFIAGKFLYHALSLSGFPL